MSSPSLVDQKDSWCMLRKIIVYVTRFATINHVCAYYTYLVHNWIHSLEDSP